jgi:hypothetical protein
VALEEECSHSDEGKFWLKKTEARCFLKLDFFLKFRLPCSSRHWYELLPFAYKTQWVGQPFSWFLVHEFAHYSLIKSESFEMG